VSPGSDSISSAPEQRSIRSYVLRQGRMTEAQRSALQRLLPIYGLPFRPTAPLDLEQVFGRRAPVVLEIGFGMGETTAAIAQAHPEVDYLGVEVHAPGVGSLLRAIEARRLGNLRVIQHDATEVVRCMIAPGALTGVHLFFPDPWPKKRHHKRRLVQPAFASVLAERLAPGGYLHAATDWEEYADWMLAVLGQTAQLVNTAERYAPRPAYRPQTKFERRGLSLGHRVYDVVFRKRP
jgi:tRNA (guanine-N7-)-methyltransferase